MISSNVFVDDQAEYTGDKMKTEIQKIIIDHTSDRARHRRRVGGTDLSGWISDQAEIDVWIDDDDGEEEGNCFGLRYDIEIHMGCRHDPEDAPDFCWGPITAIRFGERLIDGRWIGERWREPTPGEPILLSVDVMQLKIKRAKAAYVDSRLAREENEMRSDDDDKKGNENE